MKKNEYAIAVITKVIMVLIGLGESILLARYLGAELRGQLSYINSISQFLYLVATCGIYAAYPYFRKKDGKDVILPKTMSITVAMMLLYVGIAGILGVLFHKNIEVVGIIVLIPILFYNKVISFICMVERPNKRNFIVFIMGIVKLIYLFILYMMAPKTILFGITTLAIVPILESMYFTKKLKYKFSWEYCKPNQFLPLMKYGILPMIAVLLTTLNYRIDVIMLKQSPNIVLSAVGVYSIGLILSEKVLLVSDAVKEILLSKLAKGKGEKEVAKVMRMCFLVSIIMAIGVTVLSKLFINILYGEEYDGAYIVTNISVWGTIFMVFFKMVSQYNVANHKQAYNILFLTIAIVVNIIMNLILIPKFGINGAAISTALGYLISSALFLIYFHRISKIEYNKLIFIQKSDIENLYKLIYKRKEVKQ